MKKDRITVTYGHSVFSTLFIILLVLKVGKIFDITWFTVFLPVLIWLGLVVLLIVLNIIIELGKGV